MVKTLLILQGMWNASECMNFCNEFLNFVKTVVEKDHNECVYKFDWTPGKSVTVRERDAVSEYSFLPEWFINRAEPYDLRV